MSIRLVFRALVIAASIAVILAVPSGLVESAVASGCAQAASLVA